MTVPQRFVAPSMRAAMSEARRVLGPDALLLDQRTVDGQMELLVLPVNRKQTGALVESGSVAADVSPGSSLDTVVDGAAPPQGAVDQEPRSVDFPADAATETETETETETGAEDVPALDAEILIDQLPLQHAGASALPVSAPDEAPMAETSPEQPEPKAGWMLVPETRDVESALARIGFSRSVLACLSQQALTPRLAVAELVDGLTFSTATQLNGLVPVIGPPASGVTQACLQLGVDWLAEGPLGGSLCFVSPTPKGLADGERLLCGSELLGSSHDSLSPARLADWTPLNRGDGRSARALTLFDLSLARFSDYADGLLRLVQRRLLRQIVLVVPVHWRIASVQQWLGPLVAWMDAQTKESLTVHLLLSNLDQAEDLGDWIGLAFERRWHVGFARESAQLSGPVKPLTQGRLQRLLLDQIDPAPASSTVKQAQGADRGVRACTQFASSL